MKKVIKRTNYCELLAEGLVQNGTDISAVEKIYVKAEGRHEIRFAWYKEKDGKKRFVPRPLDLPEEELLELMKAGFEGNVFSEQFERGLLELLEERLEKEI